MAKMGFTWFLFLGILSLSMGRCLTAKSTFRNIMYFTG